MSSRVIPISSAEIYSPFIRFKKFAKDLKKRGFKFLGPTTVYAHMQACGMVNDHDNACFRKQEIIDLYCEKGFAKKLM